MDVNNVLYIFKFIVLFNAYSMGWEIHKISDNSYELRKKISKQRTFNLENFINKITEHPVDINNVINKI